MRRQIFTMAVTLILLLLVGSCEKEDDTLILNNDDQIVLDQTLEARTVYPNPHNFGEVIVGEFAMTVLTFINYTFNNITVNSISIEGDNVFSFTSSHTPPFNLGYLDNVDCLVTFTPTSEGQFNADLIISNGDTFIMSISGTGVEQSPPTVIDVISFLDQSVADGTITINNPSFSVLLNLALEFYENGQIEECCNKLQWIYDRSDGLPIPPDMIDGDSVMEFNQMVADLMDYLGC